MKNWILFGSEDRGTRLNFDRLRQRIKNFGKGWTVFIGMTVVACIVGVVLGSNVGRESALVDAKELIVSEPDSARCVLVGLKNGCLRGSDYVRNEWWLLKAWADYRCYAECEDTSAVGRSVEYMKNSGDAELRALAYFIDAVVLKDSPDRDMTAFTVNLLRGIGEAENCDNHFLRSQLLHRYGIALTASGRELEAIDWLQRYMDEVRAMGDKTQECIGLINMSNAYLSLAALEAEYGEKAIEYAQAALDTARRTGLRMEESKALGQLAAAYARCDQPSKALPVALEAKEMVMNLREAGLYRDAFHYFRLADIYRKLGNADSAFYYIDLEERENGDHGTQISQLRLLVWRDVMNNADSAMKYMRIYNEKKNELLRHLGTKKVLAQEAEIRERNADRDREDVRQERLWGLALGVVLLTVVVTLALRYANRYRRRAEEQEAEIGEMQREVAKTEVSMEQANNRERDLKMAMVRQNPLMESLMNKQHYLDEREWQKLYGLTDEAFDNFTKRISGRFPILTELDLQYCTLIKLHFSVGQMALLTSVSPTSVSRQKQRLKRRMLTVEPELLNGGESIDDWIQQF